MFRSVCCVLFGVALVAISLAAGPLAQQQTVIAIVGGQVIDGTPGAPMADGVVIVEGNKIQTVGPRATTQIPAGARVIDASGNTVLPGLTDMHTHAAYYTPIPREFEDDSLNGLRAAGIMRDALDAGITLLREVGSRHDVAIGLKLAIAKGYVEGPRLLVANNIVGATGAHGSENELMLFPKVLLESDSPGEWRKNIRHNFKMGADLIKVTTPFTEEEIKLAVEEAHNFGKLIAVHTSGNAYPDASETEWAVNAGADTIEHLDVIKNEAKVLEKMRKQGTFVDPTLSASRRFSGRWDAPNAEDVRRQVTQKDYEGRFRRMHAAQVKMVIGTDVNGKDQRQIGTFYRQELELFTQWGYSPHEALQAATRIGAEAAGRDSVLGTLRPGKLADVIILPGNPLTDIGAVTRPILVMKDGVVVRDHTGRPTS